MEGIAGFRRQAEQSLISGAFLSPDANNGTAVGFDFNTVTGLILRTTDGGSTWTSQSSGAFSPLVGVSFADANTGTVVGGAGTILRTTDGGNNWIPQVSGTEADLARVSFTDANNGTVV